MKAFTEEYILINGIEQYFLQYPVENSSEVVLFLHGGPGSSEAHFVYKTIKQNLPYSFVYYDQRGTGKTQSKNKSNPKDISLEVLIEDLTEIIKYIHSKYSPSKLIIVGHSWGSILGIEYIKRFPNTVAAFVGMGQVVGFIQGEKVGYDYCLDLVKQKNDLKTLKNLQEMSDYPYSFNEENVMRLVVRMRGIQLKYKLAGHRDGFFKLLSVFFKSPVFSMRDIPLLFTGLKTNNNIMKYLLNYDTSDYLEFDVPVFFICGRNDWQVPSVLTEKYYSKIQAPDKDLFWIENAGHLADLEDPEAYHNALKNVFDRL